MSERFGARAHRAGTEVLLAALLDELGARSFESVLLGWMGDAAALPDGPDPGLKHDVYLARTPAGRAWGLATNQRWEPGPRELFERSCRLAGALGNYDLDFARRVIDRLSRPGVDLCVSVGFDPGRPSPRIKFYLQEERWGAGLVGGEAWSELARSWGVPAPEGVDPAVLTLVLHEGGGRDWKIYVGAALAEDAARSLGEEAVRLAETLARSCPLQPAWHYVTLRLQGGAPAVAVNRIVDHVYWGLLAPPGRRALAWTEAEALIRHGGAGGTWAFWTRVRGLDGLLVVPTALALEAGGADLYAGAWAV